MDGESEAHGREQPQSNRAKRRECVEQAPRTPCASRGRRPQGNPRGLREVELWPRVQPADDPHAHIVAFYACVRGPGPNPADIVTGATAALTAILGHEAMTKEKLVRWDDLGVKL